MPLPLPLLLNLASAFVPAIGGLLAGVAGKRGDTDLQGKIAALVGDVRGTPGGLGGKELRDIAVANIKSEESVIQAAAETARAEAQAQVRVVEAVNATMRSEVSDPDKFRRRWRPTLAYVLALLVGVGGLAVVYAFTWTARFAPGNLELVTGQIRALLEAVEEPMRMIMGLLGGAVIARSVDKLLAARRGGGGTPPAPTLPPGGEPDTSAILRVLGEHLLAQSPTRKR